MDSVEPQEGRTSHAANFFHVAIFENVWRIYDLNSFYVAPELHMAISFLAIGVYLVIPTPGLLEAEGENVYLQKLYFSMT